MFMSNIDFISVATVVDGDVTDSIGNKKHGYISITPAMIVTALDLAGYPSNFGWCMIRVNVKTGDQSGL